MVRSHPRKARKIERRPDETDDDETAAAAARSRRDLMILAEAT